MANKCKRQGCLSQSYGQGLCETHGGIAKHQKYDRVRKDYHKLYSTKEWRAMRQRALSDNPLCMCCKFYGYLKPSVDVDHIRPWRGQLDLFYDMSNLQTLCQQCHSKKTQAESKGVLYDYRGCRVMDTNSNTITPLSKPV